MCGVPCVMRAGAVLMQLWCVDSLGTPHKVRETDSHLSPCENAGTKIIHAKLPCTMHMHAFHKSEKPGGHLGGHLGDVAFKN